MCLRVIIVRWNGQFFVESIMTFTVLTTSSANSCYSSYHPSRWWYKGLKLGGSVGKLEGGTKLRRVAGVSIAHVSPTRQLSGEREGLRHKQNCIPTQELVAFL